MGAAKRKQYSREEFLRGHPYCCYCGDVATTTDHCPPRAFFIGRGWPEGYEFPACEPCNQEARQDEQALAVLIRIKLTAAETQAGQDEWIRLFKGLCNNWPALVNEWSDVSASRRKRSFREAFGPQGDQLRQGGWGSIYLGPITQAAFKRFMAKLGKALFYRYIGRPFDGDLYVRHINGMQRDFTPERVEAMVRLAPEFAQPERSRKSLADQFIYRFNISREHGVLYTVVQFSEQMIFQIMAVSQNFAIELAELQAKSGKEMPTEGLVRAPLKYRQLATIGRPTAPPKDGPMRS